MVDLIDRSPLSPAGEPLSRKAIDLDGLHLSEQPRAGLLRLQGQGEQLRGTLEGVLGAALPEAPNRWVAATEAEVIWLGPTRWLVRTAAGSSALLAAKLSSGLGDTPHMITDVSHQFVEVILSGPRAKDFLRRCCGLDVDGPSLGAGGAARTLFSDLPVLIQCLGQGSDYRFYLDQSLARFAWNRFKIIAEDAL